MARITVEDCMDHVENRFELVLIASKRARQIAHGGASLVPEEGDKPTVLALREVATGEINEARVKDLQLELDAARAAAETERESLGHEAGDE